MAAWLALVIVVVGVVSSVALEATDYPDGLYDVYYHAGLNWFWWSSGGGIYFDLGFAASLGLWIAVVANVVARSARAAGAVTAIRVVALLCGLAAIGFWLLEVNDFGGLDEILDRPFDIGTSGALLTLLLTALVALPRSPQRT